VINVDELIQSYESKTKNKKQKFNDFLYHCFQIFESMIKNKKLKKHKDKYIIMRQKLINYLIANERSVTSKLCR
jgi:hypothetical protein|tara:strand:+ start:266 stop:487 length:222 start_codon:yes stop_codon:yes gene_type:complete